MEGKVLPTAVRTAMAKKSQAATTLMRRASRRGKAGPLARRGQLPAKQATAKRLKAKTKQVRRPGRPTKLFINSMIKMKVASRRAAQKRVRWTRERLGSARQAVVGHSNLGKAAVGAPTLQQNKAQRVSDFQLG
jgi:hypothetical protein